MNSVVCLGTYYLSAERNDCLHDRAAQRKFGLQRMRITFHAISAKRRLMAWTITGIIT
jgi:hypothetical protein